MTLVMKEADEDRSSGDIVADDELTIELDADITYIVHGQLFMKNIVNPAQVRLGMLYGGDGENLKLAGYIITENNLNSAGDRLESVGAFTRPLGGGAGKQGAIYVDGYIYSGSGGELSVGWGIFYPGTVRIESGSWLQVEEV